MAPQFDIPRIIRGDMDAFRVLFESFYVPLRNFASSYISDEESAKDVAQDSLIKYWLRREEFDDIRKIRSFLYTATRNAVLNELEHRRVVERHAPAVTDAITQEQTDVGDAEDSMRIVEAEVYRMLRDGIESLPSRTKEIMLLSLAGENTGQIANSIGIARETVRTLKKAAHKKLRLRVGRYRWMWEQLKLK